MKFKILKKAAIYEGGQELWAKVKRAYNLLDVGINSKVEKIPQKNYKRLNELLDEVINIAKDVEYFDL